MIRVLRIFSSNPFGHGGERRTAQLEEIYRSFGVERDYFCQIPVRGWRKPLRSLAVAFRQFGWRLLLHPRRLWNYWRYLSRDFIISFEQFARAEGRVVLMETLIEEFRPLFRMLRREGKTVVAFPHNIESMVANMHSVFTDKPLPHSFLNEIECYRQCDAVFCISREETWLLQLWGINAHFLPYYPAQECEQTLLRLREKRLSRQPNEVLSLLMVGSAINGPTARGMQQVIDWLIAHKEVNIRLWIGGFETEKRLSLPAKDDRIILYGSLSNEQLDQLQTDCDGLLIWQPATTGALTRIGEALIAGIPVIANTPSLRTYYNTHGITEITTLDSLSTLTPHDLSIPAIPQKTDITELKKIICK